MPNVKPGESRNDFVSRCVPIVLDEGTAKDQDQAVAVCSQMWRDRAKTLVMKVTKVQRLENGRTRWQARANTGEFDLLQERFDQEFFDDIVTNFYRTKEALSRGNAPPDGMTEPILDISHYSIYLPADKRDLARAGWIDKMWRDGRALFAQGFFDDTRLGHIAEKAAYERKPEDRRVSIVVYPDYSLVDVEAGGRKVYRGGNGVAWMDSLAMTSTPCDPGAVMEVKSMTTIAEDAKNVLGNDGNEIVDELEAARTSKALPDGALIKTDDDEEMSDADSEQASDETTEPTPAPEYATMEQVQEWLGSQVPGLSEQVNQAIAPLAEQIQELSGKTAGIEEQIKSLQTTEAAKVQKAIQNEGNIFQQMWPNEAALSVQGEKSTAKGEVKTPQETDDKSGTLYQSWFGK